MIKCQGEGLSDVVEIEGHTVKIPEWDRLSSLLGLLLIMIKWIFFEIIIRYPDIVMAITYGDFGKADPDVVEASGHPQYNMEVEI